MGDLKWLRERPEAAICRHASRAARLWALRRLQMLGSRLSDPEGWRPEARCGAWAYWRRETVFQGEKTRTRVRGRVLQAQGIFEPLAGNGLSGYEIHMGRTTSPLRPLQSWREAKAAGMGCAPGMCLGPMSTAFFDEGAFSRAFVNCILRSLGLTETTGAVDWRTYKERQYDALAQGCGRPWICPTFTAFLGLPTGENRK